jgi:hypothetical protein
MPNDDSIKESANDGEIVCVNTDQKITNLFPSDYLIFEKATILDEKEDDIIDGISFLGHKFEHLFETGIDSSLAEIFGEVGTDKINSLSETDGFSDAVSDLETRVLISKCENNISRGDQVRSSSPPVVVQNPVSKHSKWKELDKHILIHQPKSIIAEINEKASKIIEDRSNILERRFENLSETTSGRITSLFKTLQKNE